MELSHIDLAVLITQYVHEKLWFCKDCVLYILRVGFIQIPNRIRL
jgi:hypothetical protein